MSHDLGLAAPAPFLPAAARSVRSWGSAAALAAVATWQLAQHGLALPLVHAAVWLLTGLVAMPVLFTVALALTVVAMWTLLATITLPCWATGRTTGLGALARALWALPAHVLPGYWRALRRVERPVLWGLLLGFLLGLGGHVAAHGLRPMGT